MVKPKTKEDYYNLGNLYLERGQIKEATKVYKKALKMGLVDARLFNNFGITLKQQDKRTEAEKYFQKAIKKDPTLYGAYNNLGNIEILNRNFKEAEKYFINAFEINPYFKDAYNNLGTIWQALGDLTKAENYYRLALEINPNYIDALNNLGTIYQYKGEMQKALEVYKHALKINNKNADIYFNLASAYGLENIAQSIKNSEKAIAIKPDYQDAFYLLLRQLQVICEWDKFDKLLPKLKKMTSDAIAKNERPGEALFFTIGNWDDPKRIYEVGKAWNNYMLEKILPYSKPYDFKNRRQKNKLRIGYISSDFRNHVIAHQMVDMYKLHDRENFEIFTYSLDSDDKNYFKKQISMHTKFTNISELSYIDAANKIYNDEIDILVDLNGYTKGARLEILALKPAPIQITYLGFPSTTGASFFDYTIADKNLVPKKYQKYYSEEIIYMPDCYQVQSYGRFKNLQTKLETKNKTFVFASFNNNFKIRRNVFETWMNILKQVPNSVLWLLDERKESTENLIKYAKKYGVDEKRIIFQKRLNLKKHLERLTDVDLCLDTYPYNGGATTSNALFAGVPVVTLQGKNYVARMSSSLLISAQIPEMITQNLKNYEELAIKLATNKMQLIKIKRKLKNARNGNLFNTKLFVENLEKEYKKICLNKV
ncbi:hypothetical protein BH10PAT1_BH10PAT1_1000 [soil metagenome]